jgi:hypothetical protein
MKPYKEKNWNSIKENKLYLYIMEHSSSVVNFLVVYELIQFLLLIAYKPYQGGKISLTVIGSCMVPVHEQHLNRI